MVTRSDGPRDNARDGAVQDGAVRASARGKRVGLKDIADELGISQTAVSFAINDRPGVSEETKRKVKMAAAKLGWTPVYAAQALGSSKTMTVGFAPSRSADELQDESFMLHFMTGLHASFSRKGYGLLYRPCASLREELAVYRDWSARKRVDGVVLVDLRADDPRPALLNSLGVPAVLAGGPDPSSLMPSLSIDDGGTMETVLRHLLERGHRRIAYISGDPTLDYSKDREAAFRAFAKRRRLESIHVEFTDFKTERASELTLRLMALPVPPTAFIYESETLAAASLRSIAAHLIAQGRGLEGVPAIVSFEDSFICEAAYPSITSVHRDASEYGAKVAKLLLKVLAGDPVSGNRRILKPELVIRESTSRSIDV
ncbi:LacI family transcriptional regulator [Bifidobacterium sp. UTCIF-37]|uniref:LacI family DNA-binding transcriptional regulator n=1 Tax=unclassified Bifidobacterium TaxID=2608897 RepID=UPI00112A6784|nr:MULTISPECIES: LacI family DNA-binding transcriptional regulator [unclassified Bifidobacterium]TPF87402.1 LacI family transcriptional regulator [Bifidobacterium sp. UTCIF-37]TPF91178.1 LacI family transcriptional regulator [Bifidobacterium sp. UTCIF-38]